MVRIYGAPVFHVQHRNEQSSETVRNSGTLSLQTSPHTEPLWPWKVFKFSTCTKVRTILWTATSTNQLGKEMRCKYEWKMTKCENCLTVVVTVVWPPVVSRAALCHHQTPWTQSVPLSCLYNGKDDTGASESQHFLMKSKKKGKDLKFGCVHFLQCKPGFGRTEQWWMRWLCAAMWQISALVSHIQTWSAPSAQPAITYGP